MSRIDLNCDLGESFGAYSIGNDDAVLPWITSANIACGAHAGDAAVMRRTVAACVKHGVAIGAHPGLPDLAGFGRRNMQISADEAYELVVYQTGALLGFVRAAGAKLVHVKPHGALYNMAAANTGLAEAIARAVRDVDPSLTLFGLANSELIAAGRRVGIATAAEAFADRNYTAQGALVARTHADALVHDAQEALRRVVRMVQEGRVRSVSGDDVALKPDTICIHGDGPNAPLFARTLREGLEREGITVSAHGH